MISRVLKVPTPPNNVTVNTSWLDNLTNAKLWYTALAVLIVTAIIITIWKSLPKWLLITVVILGLIAGGFIAVNKKALGR